MNELAEDQIKTEIGSIFTVVKKEEFFETSNIKIVVKKEEFFETSQIKTEFNKDIK